MDKTDVDLYDGRMDLADSLDVGQHCFSIFKYENLFKTATRSHRKYSPLALGSTSRKFFACQQIPSEQTLTMTGSEMRNNRIYF